MKKKVIVVSIDSLISADIPILKGLPNIGRLMEKASYAVDIECVYPTLTYPCHTTIVTGVYPDRHGISNNEVLDINAGKADWYWWRKDVKTSTVIDIAKEAGLSTATVTWPVMCASGADYNIGEIWAPSERDDPTPYFDQADSLAVKHIFERNKKKLRWLCTPEFDEFAAACASDIIHEFHPDLMLVHFSYVDHQRHKLGVDSPAITGPLAFVDEKIGQIMKAVEEEGLSDQTEYVILGDHGQINCHAVFHLNKVLMEMGYIDIDEENLVSGYRIYSHSCAYSAQIYLDHGMNEKEAMEILTEIQKKYPECIQRIYTKQEVKKKFHTDGSFQFMLEGCDGVSFGKTVLSDQVVETAIDNSDYRWSNSTHGHDPRKGDKPPFIISGPSAARDRVLHGGRLVDEAPTIMKLFGIDMKNVDGQVMEDLLCR